MSTDQLLKTVLASLDDGKGNDIQVIDVQGKTSVADFMVIASGTSERHVKFLADQVIAAAKKNKFKPLGIEGYIIGDWVLADLGDIIVHVMLPQTRAFYRLEKLWNTDFETACAKAI